MPHRPCEPLRPARAPRSRLRAALLLCATVAALPLLGCDSGPEPTTDSQPPDMTAPPSKLGPDEIPLKVAQRCPGDPKCPDQGDGVLYVGFAKRDITPPVEPFEDTNKNGRWDEGEPFTDLNGNKKFDAFWVAGYGIGRQAVGVHDPLWARAIALRQNETTVVLVASDVVGLFREETHEVQKILDQAWGPKLAIDLLLLHATHNHEAADTTGGWGPDIVTWGIDAEYQKRWRRLMAEAVAEAVQAIKPARVTIGSIRVEDPPSGDMSQYVADSRQPTVIDNTLHAFLFVDPTNTPPVPIATLVNWANHPEALGGSNQFLTSDFPGYLRDALEKQGTGPVVYVSGPLGGLLGPGRAAPIDPDTGKAVKESGFRKAQLIGEKVAAFALNALGDKDASVVEGKQARLAFRTAEFNAHIENSKYHLASMLGLFRREFCCYDMTRPVGIDNPPQVRTAVTYLTLGPAAIITNPGELTSELFLGGYDGSRRGTYDLLNPAEPNGPDLTMAPKPPYLIDLMDGEPRHRMTFGLTGDFLGYILPRYNFVLDENAPYLREARGDHYEETNSIGPRAEAEIVGTMRQLILDGREPSGKQ
jgi:hypothetical protein